MKNKVYEEHKAEFCNEIPIQCKKCLAKYKWRDKERHDCVTFLQNEVKAAREENEEQKKEIETIWKDQDHMMNELNFLKMFISKRFDWNVNDLCYAQELTPTKILD